MAYGFAEVRMVDSVTPHSKRCLHPHIPIFHFPIFQFLYV